MSARVALHLAERSLRQARNQPMARRHDRAWLWCRRQGYIPAHLTVVKLSGALIVWGMTEKMPYPRKVVAS